MTSEDVQRYARIGLQWLASALVSYGAISPGASWVEPAIGVGVGLASLAWTVYGNRLNAKIAEVAKAPEVKKIVAAPEIANVDLAENPKVVAKG